MTVGDCPQTFGVNLGTKYVKEKNNLMTNIMFFDEHYANTLTNTKLSPKKVHESLISRSVITFLL